jgi:hypothetical protein
VRLSILKDAEAFKKLREFWQRIWADPGIRLAVLIFIGVRIALLIFARVANDIYPETFDPHPVLRPYLGVAPATNPWIEPWQRWDTLHFQAIAERGYRAYNSSLFTPFLYPFLIRVVATVIGGDTLIAGLIISNLAFLAALIFLYRLVDLELDHEVAQLSILYLAFFPTALFFFAAYSESLFLLTAVAAIYYARHKRWVLAGAWAFFAPLTRMQGAILPLVIAFEIWRTRRVDPSPLVNKITGVVLSALGAVTFPLYVWWGLGKSPWEPLIVQSSRFHGSFAIPGYSLIKASQVIFGGEPLMMDYFDLGFALLFILLTVLVVRRLDAVYGLYSVLMLMVILSKVGDIQPLLSVPRYMLAIFPAFIILGRAGKDPLVNRIILYSSWLGLLYFCGQFVIWGWVA